MFYLISGGPWWRYAFYWVLLFKLIIISSEVWLHYIHVTASPTVLLIKCVDNLTSVSWLSPHSHRAETEISADEIISPPGPFGRCSGGFDCKSWSCKYHRVLKQPVTHAVKLSKLWQCFGIMYPIQTLQMDLHINLYSRWFQWCSGWF